MSEQQGVQAATTPLTIAAEENVEGLEPSGEGLQADTFRLPVKFNKQEYQLTVEQATALAQKGMKFDTIEPMLEQLKGLAGAHGLGVRELVECLCAEPSTPPSDEERLAEEFAVLKAECPQVTSIEAVPEPVLQMAVNDGVTLLDAYLRHEYRERRRIEEAGAAAMAAATASAGAQRGDKEGLMDPAVEAMLAGVRGA